MSSENQNWPDSREQLLKDIETFSENGPPKEAPPAPPQRYTPAARPATQTAGISTPASTAAAAPASIPAPAASAASATLPAESAHASSSLLGALKQQASAKLQNEVQKSSLQVEQRVRMSEALQRAFRYFDELVKQLNVLKPPYEKSCSFFGVVDFDEMHWEEGRADYRMEQVASEDRLFDQASLRYRLVAPKKFSVTRENPAMEKLRKALFDHGIVFTTDEQLNDRARVERTTFTFPCEIKAGLLLMGDAATGEVVLRTRNIERFGAMEYRTTPEVITTATLDELTLMILGKPSRVGQLLRRSI